MRESAFYNVKCWNSGSASEPAVDISSTTRETSDATNELDVFKLAIFSARSVGLAVRNPNRFGATRGIRFFGLRVEHSGTDGVDIASPGDQSVVSHIRFYDLSVITSGSAGLRIGAAASGAQSYMIGINGGEIGPGNAIGIRIDNGRLIDIDLDNVDAPIVLGPDAGADINIRGNGAQYDWKFVGADPPGRVAAPLDLRAPYGLYGLPNAGQRIGAAALQAKVADDKPVRLTMDGKPADAYNCFNPAPGQTFNLNIQLMAQDRALPGRWYAWTEPLAVLSAWYGPSAAQLSIGSPIIRAGAGAESASVSISADRRDGCLDLIFAPPSGNVDLWDATASLQFARTP